jgi:predicted DCC family thiol-disulfide oxidoreductase YuxK
MTQADPEEILLVYDKHCPVCDSYCRLVRIEESIGDLKLIDARESSDALEEITTLGLDIDQGMVLKKGREIHYGSDAIHALARMSNQSSLFNRLNYLLFSSKRVSRFLYPALRSCRNLLLKILGKTKVNNLGRKNNERF